MCNIEYVGSVRMQAVENNKNDPAFLKKYPFVMPKVFLEGYSDPYVYDGGMDSVVLVREDRVTIYSDGNFAELLEKDKGGNVVWVDGRSILYDEGWDAERFVGIREAEERTVTEYDLKTLEKRKYKVVLDETAKMNEEELCRVEEYLGGKIIDDYFAVNNGVLKYCLKADADLVIPDSVVEIEEDVFSYVRYFENVSIPESLINIPESFFKNCRTKCVTVAENNPRYYVENGCLIDRQSATLVWAYAGMVIPNDGSVSKIGSNAFCERYDLKSIIIPNSITEIANDAFGPHGVLKEVSMPDAFENMVEDIFGKDYVKKDDKWISEKRFPF